MTTPKTQIDLDHEFAMRLTIQETRRAIDAKANEHAASQLAVRLAEEEYNERAARRLAEEEANERAARQLAASLATIDADDHAARQLAARLATEEADERAARQLAARLAAEEANERAARQLAARLATEEANERAARQLAARLATTDADELASRQLAARLAHDSSTRAYPYREIDRNNVMYNHDGPSKYVYRIAVTDGKGDTSSFPSGMQLNEIYTRALTAADPIRPGTNPITSYDGVGVTYRDGTRAIGVNQLVDVDGKVVGTQKCFFIALFDSNMGFFSKFKPTGFPPIDSPVALYRYLVKVGANLPDANSPTDDAHIASIAERLGVTITMYYDIKFKQYPNARNPDQKDVLLVVHHGNHYITARG